MKKCPSCCFDNNPDAELKCGICGHDIAAVPPRAQPPPPRKREAASLITTGLLIIFCSLFWFLMQTHAERAAAVKAAAAPMTDDAAFDYDGALYSLGKMGELRFLPMKDKMKVLPLLSSKDERVVYAAAKLLGEWSRSDKAPGDRKTWFEILLKTAASGQAAARRQAAFEAGVTAAAGYPFRPYLEEIRRASAALIAEPDMELETAGFFLASMAGIEDFNDKISDTFRNSPVASTRLYAACALSRLGRPEGHAYLLKAAAGVEADLRNEAVSCLAYSASPEAGRFLLTASRDTFYPETAEAAKRALMFRKQLAIIKQ